MTQYLKQSTAYTFQLGPFVDATDGVTPETGLTIAATDVDLSKNGGAFADKTEATALTGTGDAQGWYDCVLDTTDTGTLGKLDVRCYVSGALPVWKSFMVLAAASYELLVTGTARTVEGTYDEIEVLKLVLAAIAGKTTGGGSATLNFRDTADSKNRIVATVDANKNRTAMTLDVT